MKLKCKPLLVLALAALFIFVFAGELLSQSPLITHTITTTKKDSSRFFGREYWLTIPEIPADKNTSYTLYITGEKNTTVSIQSSIGGSISNLPVIEGQVVNFTIPLAWGTGNSGVVEQRGIHVWSNDADIVVNLLSRNSSMCDGTLVLPCNGWGNEYVVASYESLFEGYGSFVYDYPSEFSIVANQSNTICTITPSCDLRCENGMTLVHKAHVKFTETLNRGESVQYKVMIAQNCDDYDVTGTIVTSNNPVGIFGASQGPNIPCENQYGNFICEMLPPLRTWGTTYQTIPFDTRLAGDTYLVVASKDNQVIIRNGQMYAVLSTKYSYYFRPDVQDAAVWSSDAPFMLVQYINSTTFEANNGGSNAGRGNPAMVVINPVEQYSSKVIFQTPNITGSGGFLNFAHVFVLTSEIGNTTFDGKRIDSVCEMIPPVRAWGKSYHSVPFDTRIAGDTYLVIASKDGQVIKSNGQQYAILPTKYSYYFRPDVQVPTTWTSDAPFLLVQYINSTTFEANNGGSNAGRGDPAMVVINSVEHYSPHIVFLTPDIQGSGGFSDYANVFVLTSEIIHTTFDGQPINSVKGATRAVLPGSLYTPFRIANISPGRHEILSSQGVGVYLYGYGSYDSYAWSGNLGISTTNSPDTIPPLASATGQCFRTHVILKDLRENDSKLNSIVADSVYNISFIPDTNFVAGAWIDTSFYNLHIIDSSKEAYAKIFAYDVAGNRTTITSTYVPELAAIDPPAGNYGQGNIGTKQFLYFTITNTGTIPFNWQSIVLQLGTKGFVIDSGLVPNTPISVGGTRIIKVSFVPPSYPLTYDTLVVSDGCTIYKVALVGSGGQPNFTLTDHDFKCIDIGTSKIDTAVVAFNMWNTAIHIDAIRIDDPVHFCLCIKSIPPF